MSISSEPNGISLLLLQDEWPGLGRVCPQSLPGELNPSLRYSGYERVSRTRIFFWASTGQVVYAAVESSSRLTDGTQILVLRTDDNRVITMPACGVTHLNQ
ncbi:hypothetical protein BKA70DRAFT_1416700 [Coprinopsis sp. MPI-PUGE-AT-0042]|nr:hypothetical protein BKA70DRAFT_1416700 [Coprinopsis sp. MPI-PUGE-AT-0042]